ncbi:hypothetical protein AcW1_003116 [Taiwanofungus camphoratus]|nr:hypothetical protein AcV5_001691 [Antrodia cinnamomea]KAI0942502.1 hypothetical protein AcW1_003116 [Antrodia cinnamomea]
MSEIKFRVAIIGAGIGGLTFAVSLRKFCKNVTVDIYESAAMFAEIGAGIGLWPRVWEVMKSLGLNEDLQAIGSGIDNDLWIPFEYRKSDQPEGVAFYETTTRVGLATFHRAEFQDVLCRHLSKSDNVHFSKRLASYTESSSGEINLKFLDGSTATCDVLVGCDGIRSVVRGVLYHNLAADAKSSGDIAKAAALLTHVNPSWTGTVAYRGLVPKDILERDYPENLALTKPMMCFGKNKHLIIYPVSRGRVINIVAFVSEPEREGTVYDSVWARKATKEEFIDKFSPVEPDVKNLLSCLTDVSLWAINSLPSLPTYIGGRVALVGDAAHAMTPHQGSGAGQAFEDGYVLAALLAHPAVTLETLPRALQVYDEIRRPFSQGVLRRSRDTGFLLELNSPGFEDLTEEKSAEGNVTSGKLEEVGKGMDDIMAWLGNTSIMGDCERALEVLEDALRQSN